MRALSVRTKLFLGTGLVVLGFGVTAMVSIASLIEGFVGSEVGQSLQRATKGFHEFDKKHRAALEQSARTLAAMPRLRDELAQPGLDREAALLVAHQARDLAGSDYVVILDARQRVLADTLHTDTYRLELPIPEAHTDCSDGVFLVASAAIGEGEQRLGTLLLGEMLGEQSLRELREQTGVDVSLVQYGRVTARCWTNPRAPAPRPEELARAHGMDPQRLTLGGDSTVAAAVPLTRNASLLLSRSIADLMALYHQVWVRILCGGLVAGGLALLLSSIVARKLAQPIQQLTEASRALASGNFRIEVPDSNTRELTILGVSFNRMAQRIERLIAEANHSADLVAEQQKALELSHRAKSHLLTNASHELLTPVTNVCASAEILLDYLDAGTGPQQEEFLHIIKAESERLSRVVRQILDMATLENGMMAWNVTDLDLAEVVRASIAMTREERDDAHGRIAFSVKRRRYPFRGDGQRLAQAIGNTIGNAVKFSPPRSRVRVSLTADADGYEIRVVDRGPGIPGDAEKRRIFETFAQRGDLLTAKPAGTGLGLPIAREILRAHGGGIHCTDRPGGGAVFVIRLPLVSALRPTADAAEREEIATGGATPT
jgi:signal transduction histidine kinase